MRKLLLSLAILASLAVGAQNKVVGFWYGTANVKTGGSTNNYQMEIIVSQSGSTVQGVMNYYFRNTFRSIPLKGVYNPANRQLQIKDIALTYHGSTFGNEVDCMMDFIGTLRVSQTSSVLAGRFYSKPEYRNTCPEVQFDFALDTTANNMDSLYAEIRKKRESYAVWQPSEEDTVASATVLQRPVVNYVVANEFKARPKDVQQEIEVDADSLLISFYDNGEVDGDSISVFFNDQLLSFNRKLSVKPVQVKVGLDTGREFNEISMFADNLGSIPPNTALMIIYDGKERHSLRISSSLDKSATVRVKRKKK